MDRETPDEPSDAPDPDGPQAPIEEHEFGLPEPRELEPDDWQDEREERAPDAAGDGE